MKKYIGKTDLFESSLEGQEAIIQCSFDFDLKKKKRKIRLPIPTQNCGGQQPNNYFVFLALA